MGRLGFHEIMTMTGFLRVQSCVCVCVCAHFAIYICRSMVECFLVHDDKKVSRNTGVKRMTQIDLCAVARTFPFCNRTCEHRI